MDFSFLSDSLNKMSSYGESRQAMLLQQQEELQEEIKRLESDNILLEGTQKIIQDLVHRLAVADLAELERLISWGLRSVFQLDYGFRILVDTKRNQKSFEFLFLDGQQEVSMKAIGAGVQTVIAMLMRLYVVAQLKSPKILFMDEYFHNLDSERIPACVEMVKTLCKEFGYDVLCVTHYKDVVDNLDSHLHLTYTGLEEKT